MEAEKIYLKNFNPAEVTYIPELQTLSQICLRDTPRFLNLS